MDFCPHCGSRIDVPGAKFCSKCGQPLADEVASSPPTRGGLLDPSRKYYFVKEKYWDLGYGDVYDEHGNIIGRMHRRLLSLRALIELREADNQTMVGAVHRKIVALRPTYDIKDANDRLVGRVAKKLLSFFRPSLWLEDENGRKLLTAKGNLFGWDFKIFDDKNNLVATISKADRLRDIFLGDVFDFSDKYAVHVVKDDVDRLQLLGFVIAIDNIVHDKRRR
ncbi:MAG: LURP-one-related family protein [Candidatus Baldrarchaeia archaeon]